MSRVKPTDRQCEQRGRFRAAASYAQCALADGARRERMGRAARAMFLQRFTIDRVSEGYARLYAELVQP